MDTPTQTQAPTLDYPSAIEALNRLQSSPARLAAARQSQQQRDRDKDMLDLANLAHRLGVTRAALASLRLVHIAGTKGKGSTAAFTERLLRSQGLKTGFFSSPHLVEVRERIRLNGRSLGRSEFARHFWQLFEDLSKVTAPDQFPMYFRFLTLMAMRVFLAERVDVAIVEVGIGGRYDSTNFVPDPWVCGITSLGHDHTAVLGDTLEMIAWHKAGIIKPGCVAITAPNQPPECLPVLRQEAAKVGCPRLLVAPDLSAYPDQPILSLEGYQRVNAALALQLARHWLDRHHGAAAAAASSGEALPFPISREFVEAIRSMHWPGRNTVIRRGPRCTFYLDGAHTIESCPLAADWFAASTAAAAADTPLKVLLFNRTGDRDPTDLLSPVTTRVRFDAALFCPNVVDTESRHSDTTNLKVSTDSVDAMVRENAEAFARLAPDARIASFSSVAAALGWIDSELTRPVCILATGSLHLVGCALAILQPGIAEDSEGPGTG